MRYSQPRPTGRRDRGHRVEGVGAGAHRLEAGLHPHPLLRRAGAGQVGVVLVLLDLLEAGRRVVDGSAGAEPVGPVDEQGGLVGGRHLERVHVVRRDPRDVVVDRLRCDLDRGRRHLGGDQRDLDGALRHRDRLVGGEDHPGGEPPGAAVDHAHREAEVLTVAGPLEDAVARGEVLVADPLEAEVGMADTQLPRAGQGGVPETAVGERDEGLVELRTTHDGEPIRESRGSPAGRRCGASSPAGRGPSRCP